MSDSIDVFIDRHQVLATGATAGPWRHEGADLAATLAGLVRRRAELRGAKARVWLGGQLGRPFLMPALAGLRDADERERAAQAIAPARTALAPPCRLWVEDGDGAQTRAVVAMSLPEHAQILEALRAAGIRPSSLAPWWSAALRSALRERPGLRAFAAFDGAALTLATGVGGAFSALECIAPIDAEAARAAWRRRLFADGIGGADAAHAAFDAAGRAGAAPAPEGLPLREFVQWTWGDA